MIPLPQDYSDITTPSIQIQQLNEKDINAPFHFHHEFELSLIYGKGKRLIGNHVESIHGIDLVLCGKNIPHCWFDCKRTHAITIHFSPQSGGNNNCSIPEMSGIKHLLKQSEKGLHFRGTTSRSGAHGLKVYARYIERMLHHDEFERLITLSRILKLMAEDPGRKEISGIGFSTLSNSHHVKLNHALNYIFENFTLDISIQELSDQMKMSVPAFCHFFKKHTQKRFSDYVNEVRVGYATRLLVETKRQIAEIAFQTGYNSLSNFNKRFKEINGAPPSAFKSI